MYWVRYCVQDNNNMCVTHKYKVGESVLFTMSMSILGCGYAERITKNNFVKLLHIK